MNTAEIVSIAAGGSAVSCCAIAAIAMRNAVRKGCSIVVQGPSLRITPPAVPKPESAGSVQQIAKRATA